MGNLLPCHANHGRRLTKLTDALSRNPEVFKKADQYSLYSQLNIRGYAELCLHAVQLDTSNVNYVAFGYLPSETGKKIVQICLDRKYCPFIIMKVRDSMFSDAEVVSAIKLGCMQARLKLKGELSPATVFEIVKSAPTILNFDRYEEYAQDKKYLEAALKALQGRQDTLCKFPAKFRNDRELVLLAVGHNAMWLQDFKDFADDVPIVMTAVTRCGLALEFASDRLRRLPEIVKAAINNNGRALEFVSSDNLRRDYDLVNQAIIQSKGYAIAHAHESLRTNPNLVKTALSLDGKNLQFLPTPLDCKPNIVKYAVANNPWTVEYLSENMNESLALAMVLLAVRKEWRVAQFIPKKFHKYSHKIALCAMRGWKVGKPYPPELRMAVVSSLYRRRPASPHGKTLTRRLPVHIFQWIFEFLCERIQTPEAWKVLRPTTGLIKSRLSPGILLNRAIELDVTALSVAGRRNLDYETAWKAVTLHGSAMQWVPSRIVSADFYRFLIRFMKIDPGNFGWVRKDDLKAMDSRILDTIINLAIPNKKWAERWLEDPGSWGAIYTRRDSSLVGNWLHEKIGANWDKEWRRRFARRCVGFLGRKAKNVIKAHTPKGLRALV